MIIDFHTHTFPDNLAEKAIGKLKAISPEATNYSDGTVAGLIKSMDAAGIDTAVTLPVATKLEQVDAIIDAAIKQKSNRIISFGALHPQTKDISAAVDRMVRGGIHGIKLHPEYQDFFIDDPRYFPLYDALQSSKLILTFHAGKDPGPFTCDHALPPALRKVIREFPALTVIASHMGGWKLWPEVEEVLVKEHIYLDTAAVQNWIGTEQFIRLVRKHGADTIVFGTDSPWFDQKRDVLWIDSLPLTASEKEAIFSGNAKRLLKI